MSITIYDKFFASSQYINFYPYIGEGYSSSQHKILMLGESHYGKKSNEFYHGWTRDVVENDFLDNYDKGKTLPEWAECHRNAANALVSVRGANPHEIYDKIAFYNFFQRRIGDGNHADKSFLTANLKVLSAKALAEVMEILRPDLIVGWGWTLESDYLPASKKIIEIKRGLAGVNLHLFTLDGFPQIPIWCMHHPSVGFGIEAHRACFAEIKKFLNW